MPTGIGALLWIAAFTALHALDVEGVAIGLFLGTIAVGGYPILRAAIAALQARRLDMNVLMSISVIGAVGKPGALPYSGRWTLLEVLTAAGGVTTARGDVVHILRRGRSGLSDQLTVRIDDLLLRGNPRANIPIYAADLVNVPPAVEVTVYCLGEVQRPGPIVFKSTERMSLLTAIARAGGLTERASKKIEIKRESPDGKVAQLEVDYKAVLAGKLPDPLLQSGDLLLVKESFF